MKTGIRKLKRIRKIRNYKLLRSILCSYSSFLQTITFPRQESNKPVTKFIPHLLQNTPQNLEYPQFNTPKPKKITYPSPRPRRKIKTLSHCHQVGARREQPNTKDPPWKLRSAALPIDELDFGSKKERKGRDQSQDSLSCPDQNRKQRSQTKQRDYRLLLLVSIKIIVFSGIIVTRNICHHITWGPLPSCVSPHCSVVVDLAIGNMFLESYSIRTHARRERRKQRRRKVMGYAVTSRQRRWFLLDKIWAYSFWFPGLYGNSCSSSKLTFVVVRGACSGL